MPRLKAFLWRAAIVVITVVVLLLVGPPLLAMLGLSALSAGPAFNLLQVLFGLIALIYIFFGPDPAPWAPF